MKCDVYNITTLIANTRKFKRGNCAGEKGIMSRHLEYIFYILLSQLLLLKQKLNPCSDSRMSAFKKTIKREELRSIQPEEESMSGSRTYSEVQR